MAPPTLLQQQHPSILSYPVPNPLAPRRTTLDEDDSDLSSDTESDIAVYRQRATAHDDSDDRLDELDEKDRLVEEGTQLAGNDHWTARHGARGRVRGQSGACSALADGSEWRSVVGFSLPFSPPLCCSSSAAPSSSPSSSQPPDDIHSTATVSNLSPWSTSKMERFGPRGRR